MQAGDVDDVFSGVDDQVPGALADHLRGIQLIDHHVHGAFNKPIDRAGFEASINEGETLKALKALYILFFLIKLKTLEAI